MAERYQVVIVGGRPVGVALGVEPLAVGVIRSLVGPLGLLDFVERLRLAIGLRPKGPRALQPQVPCRRRGGEDAAHIAGAVIGQDALDRDALTSRRTTARGRGGAATG